MTTKISKRSKRIQERREKIFSPEELEEINKKNLEKKKNYRDNFDLKQRFDEAAKMEKNDRMKVIQEENALNLDVVMC
jgi:transposase